MTKQRSAVPTRLGAGMLGLLAALLLPACGSDEASGDTKSDAGAQGDGGLSDATGSDGSLFGDALSDAPVSETGEGGGCGGQTVTASRVNVNLLVIVDRSGSMSQVPEGFAESKWKTLVGALDASLTSVQDSMSVGMVFFPDPMIVAADGCGMPTGDSLFVEINEGDTTVPLISAALADGTNEPEGNTPTADALALAYRYFTTGQGALLEGEKHVLLALDGGPNCNESITCEAATCTTNVDRSPGDPAASACPIDPQSCCGDGSDPALNKSCLDGTRTTEQVSKLASEGVSTFVVGIPGSDLYTEVLDSLAEAGGHANATSPKYFEVTDSQELSDTLLSITTELVRTCEFQLDQAPPDREKVNVYVDGVVVPQDGPDGWEYDDSTSPPTIVLKGETCERLLAEGAESVSFEFGCPTVK